MRHRFYARTSTASSENCSPALFCKGTCSTRSRSCSFRLSLLGGVRVYSKCSARDSTDIDFNGQRNGQLQSARRSVEDRLTAY